MSLARQKLELRAAAVLEKRRREIEARNRKRTVYGIVNMQREVIRRWQRIGDKAVQVVGYDEPTVLIPEKLEKLITTQKKNKVIFGGRGGAKSNTIMDVLAAEVKDDGANIMCFREVQKSLKESVFKGLSSEIERLQLTGFNPVASASEIRHDNGGLFSFWGLNSNLTNMKSLHGYKRMWVEEAEATSQDSLDVMGPTLRGMPNTELWYSLNPKSSEDPIAQQFIVPYLSEIRANGFYEDDYNLIIKVGHEDNPWFELDQSLVDSLEADKAKVRNGAMSQVKFDWIWGGEFSDEVENALIMAEWFDACIDAHKKLGFQPTGVIKAAHDPSDEGGDTKGFGVMHGSVLQALDEKTTGNVNEGGDWATGLAIQHGVNQYTWDCDGLGIGLGRDTSRALEGKGITVTMFKGSEAPDMPDAIYNPAQHESVQQQITNKDAFKNKRAQYYTSLRDRCYLTYRAITLGEYHDPDKLISFSSEIKLLSKLRAEVCRLPVKPNSNGKVELYTKAEMKSKFKMASPNLGDTVMMLMRQPHVVQQAVRMPTPVKPMRLR